MGDLVAQLMGPAAMLLGLGLLGLAAIRCGADSRGLIADDHQRPVMDGGHRA